MASAGGGRAEQVLQMTGRIGVAERPEPVRNIAADGNQIATEGAGVHKRLRASRKGPAAQPEKQRSLLSYLASRGGIRNDDGNIGDLRNSDRCQQQFIPGLGQLIRKPAQRRPQPSSPATGARWRSIRRAKRRSTGYLLKTRHPQFLSTHLIASCGASGPHGYTPKAVRSIALEHFGMVSTRTDR